MRGMHDRKQTETLRGVGGGIKEEGDAARRKRGRQ